MPDHMAGSIQTVQLSSTMAIKGRARGSWRWMKRGLLFFSIFILACFLLMALFAPYLSPYNPYDPAQVDLSRAFAPFSGEYLLGTDHLGRDVLSRLIWGARTSLGSVIFIAIFLLLSGFITGALSAYIGGWVDSMIMRVCEVFMTFQTFILALFLIAVLGRGMINVVIAIVLTHWAWYSRMVRSMVLSIKHRDYIAAAQVSGGKSLTIFIRHIAPPVLAQLMILMTLDLGHMMLHVSGLSFLGLGVQPPTPEWGIMISDAREYLWSAPSLIILPGLMIFLTVLACNIPGDYLRDKLDPSLTKEGGH